jgi:nitrite reductase/ring-hydroxylating ferredoxin subunit/uncharacterized membrane protein
MAVQGNRFVRTRAREARPSPRVTARQEWSERIVGSIQRAEPFQRVACALIGAFSRLVGPGRVKDVLSGTWMGHPTHPLLTDVTIGAWTSAVLLDLLPSERNAAAARSLCGIGVLSALPTAITGLSDLADTESRPERAIGGAHALSNTAATVLFAASWFARKGDRRGAGIALSLAGSGAATVGGFLGGHLAYRRGLGVDRTVFDDVIADWTPVTQEQELGERPIRVRVGRNDVMLFRDRDRIVAIANRCSHRGGPLHKGAVDDGTVTCPWHRSTFRLDDGAIVAGPASAPQPCYDVRVEDGQIQVRSRAKNAS